MSEYVLTVNVRDDITGGLRSMDDLLDIVEDGLRSRGCFEHDYQIEVSGPPGLRIGMVHREV